MLTAVAHLSRRLKRPVHATRLGIERIDEVVVATDEQCPTDDGGLRPGSRGGARERERPLELQLCELGAGETGGLGRLVAVGPRRVGTPTVPAWLRERIIEPERAGARVAHRISGAIGDAAERLTARQLSHGP